MAKRPTGLGASISHERGGPGSLGVLVTRNGGADRWFLSASHILAPAGAVVGDTIFHPAVGRDGAEPVATLVDAERLRSDGENQFDAAIAQLINPDDVVQHLPGIGALEGPIIEARAFASVRKAGAATGPTIGVITNPSMLARFEIDGEEHAFVGAIEVAGASTSFSQGGDSGALVVDALTRRPLGLIIGGTPLRTYVSPLTPILSRFGCRLLTTSHNSEEP